LGAGCRPPPPSTAPTAAPEPPANPPTEKQAAYLADLSRKPEIRYPQNVSTEQAALFDLFVHHELPKAVAGADKAKASALIDALGGQGKDQRAPWDKGPRTADLGALTKHLGFSRESAAPYYDHLADAIHTYAADLKARKAEYDADPDGDYEAFDAKHGPRTNPRHAAAPRWLAAVKALANVSGVVPIDPAKEMPPHPSITVSPELAAAIERRRRK
jgi:hypothetical protein